MLHVELDGGFSPSIGNSFDLIDWGSLSGKFNGLNLPPLSPGQSWSTLHLYDTGTLSVADSNRLPGDFNRNHAVDAQDVLSMLGALTNEKAYEAANGLTDADLLSIGDINGDGKFNNLDVQAMIDALKGGSGGGGFFARARTSITCADGAGNAAFGCDSSCPFSPSPQRATRGPVIFVFGSDFCSSRIPSGEAQWLACVCPCQRFVGGVTDTDA